MGRQTDGWMVQWIDDRDVICQPAALGKANRFTKFNRRFTKFIKRFTKFIKRFAKSIKRFTEVY